MHAYVDEGGTRSVSAASSDHFVMSAVAFEDARDSDARALLAQIRTDLGRRPDDHLHFVNLKQHSQRVRAAQLIGTSDFLTISSVVVCKRRFSGQKLPDDDYAYLYTLRFLLERLSWIARNRSVLTYTLAQIGKFPMSKLRAYEAKLRVDPDCRIDWAWLDPKGGKIDQPKRVEQLQLADIAASSVFHAFEPDRFGNTEERYLWGAFIRITALTCASSRSAVLASRALEAAGRTARPREVAAGMPASMPGTINET